MGVFLSEHSYLEPHLDTLVQGIWSDHLVRKPADKPDYCQKHPPRHAVHTLQYRVVFPNAKAAGRARRADRAYACVRQQVEGGRGEACSTGDGELYRPLQEESANEL